MKIFMWRDDKTILNKYNDFLKQNKAFCSHVRVTIREDESYGHAIVELNNIGTPSDIYYNSDNGGWE